MRQERAAMDVARTVHNLFCAFDRAVLKFGMFKVDSFVL
jgi:hypothetical protein